MQSKDSEIYLLGILYRLVITLNRTFCATCSNIENNKPLIDVSYLREKNREGREMGGGGGGGQTKKEKREMEIVNRDQTLK